jgi:hypothetical protein
LARCSGVFWIRPFFLKGEGGWLGGLLVLGLRALIGSGGLGW